MWSAPPWPRQGRGKGAAGLPLVTAGLPFREGDEVTRTFCLELKPDELAHSYLDAYCPRAPWPSPYGGAAPSKLFPLELGFVLLAGSDQGGLRRMAPNLVAEPVRAPPPRPPRTAEMEEDDDSDEDGQRWEPDPGAAPCAWLRFRALRNIAEGDPLVAVPQHGCGASPPNASVFEAAREAMAMDAWHLDLAAAVKERDIEKHERAPDVVVLPSDPSTMVAASPLGGVGVFARRDLHAGELLEVAPLLPMWDAESVDIDSVVSDYVMTSPWSADQGLLSFMPLGAGVIYNHAEYQNVEYVYYEATPFLQRWSALDFIARGKELFNSYGDEYWESRDMVPSEADASRWRLSRWRYALRCV